MYTRILPVPSNSTTHCLAVSGPGIGAQSNHLTVAGTSDAMCRGGQLEIRESLFNHHTTAQETSLRPVVSQEPLMSEH